MNETNLTAEEIGIIAPETPERSANDEVITEAQILDPQVYATTVAEEKVENVRPEPTRLDNILTIGLVALLALVVIAVVLRKAAAKKAPQPASQPEEPVAPVVEAPTAPGSAGEVKLHNVDPKTAAMLMAIVADKLQKPINELRFISIKEVE